MSAAVITTQEMTQALSGALRDRYRHERNATKRLADESGASDRAAKNWLEARNSMELATFFTLARRFPELKALVIELLDIQAAIPPDLEQDLARLMRSLQRNEEVRRAANDMDHAGANGDVVRQASHGPVGLARRPGSDLDAASPAVRGPAK